MRDQFDADRNEVAFETQIRHHCADHGGLCEAPFFLETLGNQRFLQGLFDDVAFFVNDHYAVCITIKRNSDIGAHFANLRAERFRRR